MLHFDPWSFYWFLDTELDVMVNKLNKYCGGNLWSINCQHNKDAEFRIFKNLHDHFGGNLLTVILWKLLTEYFEWVSGVE